MDQCLGTLVAFAEDLDSTEFTWHTTTVCNSSTVGIVVLLLPLRAPCMHMVHMQAKYVHKS